MKLEELKEVVNGNEQAFDFLCSYVTFCHLIDDVVDSPESVNDVRLVNELINFLEQIIINPWVQQHIGLLWPLVVVSANSWVDANRWEKDESVNKRRSADTLKSQYHEVAWFTAKLCGGQAHMQAMTKKYREFNYDNKEN